MRTLLKENDKAILWQVSSEGGTKTFEVWMKLFYTVGAKKGELIEPTDEDFGVKAWQTYGLQKANRIFDEITAGERTIRPMTEASEF